MSVSTTIAPVRVRVLADTLGHYPAPLAILDCIEFGAPQSFDGAIRTEMSIFAHLIQREEARNMIDTLFLAKTDYERLRGAGTLPGFVAEVEAVARAVLKRIGAPLQAIAADLLPDQQKLADYVVVSAIGHPSHLGGPFALAARLPALPGTQPIT